MRKGNSLRPAACIQAAENSFDMAGNRAGRQAQSQGYLALAHSIRKKPKHLALPCREFDCVLVDLVREPTDTGE
jgi:hypothetical protein